MADLEKDTVDLNGKREPKCKHLQFHIWWVAIYYSLSSNAGVDLYDDYRVSFFIVSIFQVVKFTVSSI